MAWRFPFFRHLFQSKKKTLQPSEIVQLKRKLDQKRGKFIPSPDLDAFLARHAPAFYQARRAITRPDFGWQTLKDYSAFCRHDANGSDYEAVLKRFDPGLHLPDIESSEFIGDGFGDDSLNAYRRVTLQGVVCFEKVYLKGSSDHERTSWFAKVVQPVLAQQGVRTPKLLFEHSGNALSACYYEYIPNLRPMEKSRIPSFYQTLYTSFQHVRSQDASHPFPPFTDHVLYQDGYGKARTLIGKWFPDRAQKLYLMQERMSHANSVFSHGDLYAKNISKEGVVFDWDRCGFYPEAFDLAYCLSKTVQFPDSVALVRYIHNNLPNFPLHSCLPNLLFFALIFYSRGVGIQAPDVFLRDLFEAAEKALTPP